MQQQSVVLHHLVEGGGFNGWQIVVSHFFVVKDAELCVCHTSLPLQHLSLLTPQHCCHLCRHLPVFLIAHLQEDLQYSNAGGIAFSFVGDICNMQKEIRPDPTRNMGRKQDESLLFLFLSIMWLPNTNGPRSINKVPRDNG